MRLRSICAVALAACTFAFLAPRGDAAPKGKDKGKDKDKAKGSGTKPIDMGNAPLPGDAPASGVATGGGGGSSAGASTGSGGGGGGSAGAAVEMTDDNTPSNDPTGTKENPNAPHTGDDDAPPTVVGTAPAPRVTGYPVQEVLRPITLPQGMSEVALDLRTAFDHADFEGILRARYGITRQVQIGVLYDIGGVYSDAAPMPTNKLSTGKAAAIDGQYLLTDWVALHLRVPFYMQPFAMAVTLGAPMKFRFTDRFAVYALDNVVDITTVNKFAPDINDEANNRVAAQISTTNPVRYDGNLRFIGSAVYQLDDKTALFGTIGVAFPNFGHSGTTAQYPLEGVVQWSPSPKLDLAGRLGVDSLGDATSTFALRVTAAFRI
jgi:hypothetical protein